MQATHVSLNLQLDITKCKYPAQLAWVIDWPSTVRHNNKTYYYNDKPGIETATGLPSAEYRHLSTDDRIWLRCDGKITED